MISFGQVQPLIGVLALQGDAREHAGAIEAAGGAAVPVRRVHELERVDGLVIPGGESTVIDRLLRVFDLFEPLRARIDAGMPTYGSCAGLILLADRVCDGANGQRTLGGLDVTVRRNAFGRQVHSFETDLQVSGITEPHSPIHAVFIRAPWIEQTGPQVRVLARLPEHSDLGAAAGRIVVVEQGGVLATAFHPEVTSDLRVHRYFVERVAAQLS